ncbi:hypothetical protein BBK14_33910 [Parafrankia soli]|uniref:Uncharacterized protein n=1 Tax=Parafrankia soli TaxID=2599596 RepID=A0A1S1Q9A3_9ACTN|nr:hypothetical protein [Parafrankia soli]OHV31438.1 hypothetical protein BBK14_33910 [Parafrankia soli]
MNYDEIFDDTVPQRAVMVTRTIRYILPVAEGAPLGDIAAELDGSDLSGFDPCTDTVSASEADSDDVLTFTASRFFPSRPLLEAAGRLVPDGPGDARNRIADAAEEIHIRRRGAVA